MTCRRDQEEDKLMNWHQSAPYWIYLWKIVSSAIIPVNSQLLMRCCILLEAVVHLFSTCRTNLPSMESKYFHYVMQTFYCSNLEIYCGKQPPAPYDVRNTPTDIVKRFVSPIENSYKNVTTDNWYTNIPLLHYLLEKKTTLLGTMKKNKSEIPPEA